MPIYDVNMVLAILITAIVGGVFGLDRTAAGQFMISQPIVAGPVTGWLLGDPTSGIVIGAALELIWVLDMPVGSFVPANSTISTVSATAIAVLGSGGHASLAVVGFSLLLTTCMVPLTMATDSIVRKWNARLWEAAAAGSGHHAGRSLAKAHLSGLAIFYLKSFVLYLVLLPAGIAAVALFLHLPELVHRAMAFFAKLLPFLGAALVVRNLSTKIIDGFLLMGFVIAVMVGQAFPVPELIVILTVIGGLLGARYREAEARR